MEKMILMSDGLFGMAGMVADVRELRLMGMRTREAKYMRMRIPWQRLR
jgi:hypothetical protein